MVRFFCVKDDSYADFRRTTDELRAEVEKIRTKLARDGFIYRPPFYLTKNIDSEKIKHRSEQEKMLAELEEVESLRSHIQSVDADIQFGKIMDKIFNRFRKDILKSRDDIKATKRQIAIWGTAIAILTPAFFVTLALSM